MASGTAVGRGDGVAPKDLSNAEGSGLAIFAGVVESPVEDDQGFFNFVPPALLTLYLSHNSHGCSSQGY